MVDEALFKYVVKQLSAGYSAQDIKSYLIQNGYTSLAIDQCLAEVYNKNQAGHYNPDHKKHIIPIIIIIFLFVSVIAFISVYLFSGEEVTFKSIDFSIELQKSSFIENELIYFTRTIENTGEDESIDVEMTYYVKDRAGTTIYSRRETLSLMNESVKEIKFNLPKAESGTYFLSAVASYTGRNKTKTESFLLVAGGSTISDDGTCFDNKKNQGEEGIDCGGPCKSCIKQCPIFFDDNNKCTNDKCGSDTNYVPVYEDIVPCCGNFVCENSESLEECPEDCEEGGSSYYNDPVAPHIDTPEIPLTEQIDMIKEIAKSDYDRAAGMCNAIKFSYYKDQCFYGISESAEEEALCDNIVEPRTKDKCYTKISKINEDSSACSKVESGLRRDSCYMRFALKGDFSICDYIEDDYYSESCLQLKLVAENAPEVIDEYAITIG